MGGCFFFWNTVYKMFCVNILYYMFIYVLFVISFVYHQQLLSSSMKPHEAASELTYYPV